MRVLLVSLLALLPLFAIAQNPNASAQGQQHGNGADASHIGAGNGEGLVHGQGVGLQAQGGGALYYTARGDTRRCIYPLCGGWWIREVNAESMRCADGSIASECYVAEVRGAAFPRAGGLLLGRPGSDWFTISGERIALGVFDADGAWRSIAGNPLPATETATFTIDTGLLCLSYPCFSLSETVLNTDEEIVASNVIFDGIDATSLDLEAARRALATVGLHAIGTNVLVPNQGPMGDGVDYVLTDAWLPLE